MLLDRELVVEHVDGGDPRPGGGERLVVRAMGDGQIEGALGKAMQLGRPTDQGQQLAGSRSPGVAAHERVVEAEAIEDPDRLGVVTGGDLDLVPLLAQPRDDRPEYDRMS